MQKLHAMLYLLLLFLIFTGCSTKQSTPVDMDNLYAWCIVPFDNQNRTSDQRITLLKKLGFKAYAYDWREEHLNDMAREIELAKANDIDVVAVWMWIDNQDAVGNLSENNRKVLQALADTQHKTQIWVSFPSNYFNNMNDEQRFEKAAEMISYVSLEAEDLGCRVGLYNHGGWFGRPENLVNIIESMPRLDLGIIFNFHHAHDMLNEFPDLVKIMQPYLWAVNLNGMRAEGPKILTIGKGDKEAEMIRILEDNGFNGPYGILGHIENADVKVILENNLKGFEAIIQHVK